jgi:hypothetical protein
MGNTVASSEPANNQYHAETLRPMERVYPFLISGILIIVGLVATSRLDARLNRYVTGDPKKAFHDDLKDNLIHLQPGSLRNVVFYWVDLTQATALIIGPLLGILILVDLAQIWIATVYAVSILVGISLILWLALCADESTYSSRSGWLGLTPVTTVGLAIDLVAGVVAYFAGRL